MGRLARTFYAHLAHLLSIKRQTRYAATMGLIRCIISFSLMTAAIMCLRGAQSSANHASRACYSIHLAVTEGHLTYLTTYLNHSTMHAIYKQSSNIQCACLRFLCTWKNSCMHVCTKNIHRSKCIHLHKLMINVSSVQIMSNLHSASVLTD